MVNMRIKLLIPINRGGLIKFHLKKDSINALKRGRGVKKTNKNSAGKIKRIITFLSLSIFSMAVLLTGNAYSYFNRTGHTPPDL
jgi:hypothetical protein